MNILMLNHHITWRGAFTRCYQFARRFIKKGHEVTLVTISLNSFLKERRFEIEGIHVIETPDLLIGKLRSGWDLWDTIYRTMVVKLADHYDIIHAFDCRPAVILPALFRHLRKKEILISDWGDWWGRGGVIQDRPYQFLNRMFEPIETFFEEYFRNKADALITVSETLKERAISMKIAPQKIKVISNGCDIETIHPILKSVARLSVGIPDCAKVLIFSAFTTYETDFLLKSFECVCKKESDVMLLVTGSKLPKNMKIPKFSNNGRLLEIGMVSRAQLNLYLSSSDVCLLPMKHNIANTARSPGKLWDYLSAGKPIVTNDVGEAGKLLRSENVGLIADYNPDVFANKIIYLLNNSKHSDTLGKRARTLAVRKFSWDSKSEELLTLYESLYP